MCVSVCEGDSPNCLVSCKLRTYPRCLGQTFAKKLFLAICFVLNISMLRGNKDICWISVLRNLKLFVCDVQKRDLRQRINCYAGIFRTHIISLYLLYNSTKIISFVR